MGGQWLIKDKGEERAGLHTNRCLATMVRPRLKQPLVNSVNGKKRKY
jgi:hypothetical protein